MQETAAVVQISVTSPDVWLARWAYHGISDMPPPRYLEPVKLSEEFFLRVLISSLRTPVEQRR